MNQAHFATIWYMPCSMAQYTPVQLGTGTQS
jgi:hypothetical protein